VSKLVINYESKIMNLKKILIPVFIFLISSEKMVAQSEVRWLNEKKPVTTGLPSDFKTLKSDENHLYYVLYPVDKSINTDANLIDFLYGVKALELHKFDFKSQMDTALIYKPDNRTFVQIIEVNNIYHIISYFKNKTQKKIFIFDETINLENLQLKNDTKLLSEIDYAEEDANNVYNFSLTISKENNQFLFLYSYILQGGHCCRFEVYDNLLKQVWTKKSNFASAGSDVYFESNYVLDLEGNIYAVQRSFDNLSNSEKSYLVFYSKNGALPKNRTLEMKLGNQLLDQKLSVNKNNELICTGLFAKVNETSAIGAFSFVFTSKLEKIKSNNFSSIDRIPNIKGLDDETKKVLNNKIILKGKTENTYQYDLKNIHYRKDGGFDLVVEKYISFKTLGHSSSLNGFGSNSEIYYYIYDDIIVLNCDSNGLFRRVQCVPKYQYLVNNQKYLGSYLLNYGENDEMNFIFNLPDTSPKNLFSKLNKDSRSVIFTLNPDGQGSIQELFNDHECSNSFLPLISTNAGDNHAILFKCNKPFSKGNIAFKKYRIVIGELDIK